MDCQLSFSFLCNELWWQSESHPHGKRLYCILVETRASDKATIACFLLHTASFRETFLGARSKFSISISQETNLIIFFMDISQGIYFHLSERLKARLDFTLRTSYNIYVIIWNRFVGPKAHI